MTTAIYLPPLTLPDVADVTCPFLVRVICVKAPVQQVGRKSNHVGPLPLAGRAAAKGAQATFADI